MGGIIMKQEYKELLLKDLGGRLPSGVKILDVPVNVVGKLFLISTTDTVQYETADDTGMQTLYNIKPYLLPLSSMTEEEQRTLDSMCNGVEMASRLSGLKMFDKAFNWLNENHFDYRGLIEKGLAIDATGLNIY